MAANHRAAMPGSLNQMLQHMPPAFNPSGLLDAARCLLNPGGGTPVSQDGQARLLVRSPAAGIVRIPPANAADPIINITEKP
jgi:hypothetical protein